MAAAHQFKPGQSGNPKGGPRKPRYFTQFVRDAVSEHMPVLITKVLEEANDKRDTVKRRVARDLAFRYLLPKVRLIAEPIDLPAPGSLAESRAIIIDLAQRMAKGTVDIDAFNALVAALRVTDDLARIDMLAQLKDLDAQVDQRLNEGGVHVTTEGDPDGGTVERGDPQEDQRGEGEGQASGPSLGNPDQEPS